MEIKFDSLNKKKVTLKQGTKSFVIDLTEQNSGDASAVDKEIKAMARGLAKELETPAAKTYTTDFKKGEVVYKDDASK